MTKPEVCKIEKDYPYELLLLADETTEAINQYIHNSDVYIARIRKETVAVFCLLLIDKKTIEIKNIAVCKTQQNKGIGTYLLTQIEAIAIRNNYETIIVGTADCGLKQINFYKKNGYFKYAVKRNFFIENYKNPIYENGLQLKDMMMLKKEIKKPDAPIEKPDIFPD